ncbi:hypothetical protein GHT06_014539 [Daphnia sinensis]|uniref:Uncharacterized protein n=1 Tax=Daphnia sinensis TaxID=1820382 RepID=A0AAD5PWF0_9CRUS|nr:hypothetical protein GHT06_014539 [Daphnia sinensis]
MKLLHFGSNFQLIFVLSITRSQPDKMLSKLQGTIVALVCSFTSSVSATNVQHSQMHAYLPLYSGQAFNPAHFPLMLPPATSPQSPISEGVLRSKGLGLIDLILLKQLTSRISQLEETAKNVMSSNSQLEGTVDNLTISNNQLEDFFLLNQP